ncbi:MAG: permease [Kineosporiaceae bacterium]|nr:permease [Kineosporiaceae bacterium]
MNEQPSRDPDQTRPAGTQPTTPQPTVVVQRERDWSTRIVLVLVTVVLLALAGLLAVTWLPSWWAHRVGDVADGTMSSATFAGLTCGFVFTAIPLLLLRRVFARHGGLGLRMVWLMLAVVFAAPNLITLGIVLGNGNSAHAAERTFDVEAPGFRNATAIGAAVAVVFVVMLWALLASRRRRSRQLHERDAELKALRQQVGESGGH